jgi:hypothetical protein
MRPLCFLGLWRDARGPRILDLDGRRIRSRDGNRFPRLSIVPKAHLLYAATDGRSAWVLQLPEGE